MGKIPFVSRSSTTLAVGSRDRVGNAKKRGFAPWVVRLGCRGPTLRSARSFRAQDPFRGRDEAVFRTSKKRGTDREPSRRRRVDPPSRASLGLSFPFASRGSGPVLPFPSGSLFRSIERPFPDPSRSMDRTGTPTVCPPGRSPGSNPGERDPFSSFEIEGQTGKLGPDGFGFDPIRSIDGSGPSTGEGVGEGLRRDRSTVHATARSGMDGPKRGGSGMRRARTRASARFSLASGSRKGRRPSEEEIRDLLERGERSLPWSEGRRVQEKRVLGCTTRTWLEARRCPGGQGLEFEVDSDSQLTRGVGSLACESLRGRDADEVIDLDVKTFGRDIGLSDAFLSPSHANGFQNLINAMKKRAAVLRGNGGVDGVEVPDAFRFPSMRIASDEVEAQGGFAVAQAQFLKPDMEQVRGLVGVLQQKRIGVVAHFYMDPEVQGVLSEAAAEWPHICISDSLLMADKAVRMVEEGGCRSICVLGVDFMSENVRAILDEAGHKDVQVYRMASDPIGCSLAEAAESLQYEAYLQEASRTPNSVHVVYINTSLRTKAKAQSLVPTITCTSSNVVQTVLTAFAQVPGVTVWYGPDTYMGANIEKLLMDLSEMDDSTIQALHPEHTQETIKSILPRFKYFREGSCIVHDLFGGEVCDTVRTYYRDAYLAAHFEVPGEMFVLAMEAKQRGMGVVGSTQNILDFVCDRLDQAIQQGESDETLRFVLGTESGMITSIVRHVQARLRPVKASHQGLSVEIVFPVSKDAISRPDEGETGLEAVPGTLLSEGCSLSGGCASCPYMKMNHLDALQYVCGEIVEDGSLPPSLLPFLPKKYEEEGPVPGMSLASAGCIPILHMRGFQRDKSLPDALVMDISTRNKLASTPLPPSR